MKKTFKLFGIFTLVLLSCLVFAVCSNSSGGGGGGGGGGDGLSEETAFLVRNKTELGYVGRGDANPAGYKNWNGTSFYKQTADIDMSGIDWIPIQGDPPSGGANFAGGYDGCGYAIKNLTVNAPDDMKVGLFGNASGDSYRNNSIKNIALINCNITGGIYVGGIVGDGGIPIENCYVTGTVRGRECVGGIVGYRTYSDVIKNCYTTCDVLEIDDGGTPGDGFGGIIGGSNTIINVTNCFATGNVSGRNLIGGIAGFNDDESIKNCVALNKTITAKDLFLGMIGRISGKNFNGTFSNNYGRSDMDIVYSAPTRNPGYIDGDSVSQADALSPTWWTTAANWDASSPWDFTNTWNLPSGSTLPTLKVFDGKQTQNPVIN